ncbi:MAG: hypothetical protein CMF74_14505 [Maricaulis sp.]|nr:hypothetical protein [Maricaulis sp.]
MQQMLLKIMMELLGRQELLLVKTWIQVREKEVKQLQLLLEQDGLEQEVKLKQLIYLHQILGQQDLQHLVV